MTPQAMRFQKYRTLLIAFAMLLTTACQGGRGADEPATVTHCIGRYLIDLPAGFRQVDHTTATFFPAQDNPLEAKMEVEIVATGVDRRFFEEEVGRRKAELAEDGSDTEDPMKSVVAVSENAVMFRVPKIHDSYTSELDLLIGSTLVRISANSYHASYGEVESVLKRFASGIVPIGTHAEAGFCLGPVSVLGVNTQEISSQGFRSARQPDVYVNVDMNTYTKDPESLLSRVSGVNSLLRVFSVRHRVLRKGELTVAGMRAEEWLASARLGDEHALKYQFVLETYRPTPGPLQPRIRLELNSGQHDANGDERANSLTDREGKRTWDALVQSIRPAHPLPSAPRSPDPSRPPDAAAVEVGTGIGTD